MEVICIQTEAYYNLVKELIDYVKSQEKTEEEWIDGDTARSILKVGKTKMQNLRNEVNCIRFSQLSRKQILYYRPSLIEFLEQNVKQY